MNKLFIILPIWLLTTACNTVPATPGLTEEYTPEPAPENWFHGEIKGVAVDVLVPLNWEATIPEDGEAITLVEHAGLNENGTAEGILVSVFVHELDDMVDVETVDNPALAVLNYVAHNPDYVNDSPVSEPAAFTWDGHHAAYYLRSGVDGIYVMVLAVMLPTEQLLVCNIATPARESQRIRESLPLLLGNLKINGALLDGAHLDDLPNPLNFPDVVPEIPEATDDGW